MFVNEISYIYGEEELLLIIAFNQHGFTIDSIVSVSFD